MNRLFLVGVALMAVVAGPALAADLPARPTPVYKAPVIATYSWTGCYVGGNVGGMWVRKDWTGAPGGFFAPGSAYGNQDASGWVGGVQAGCNYQIGGWVFGIQGDYDWANAEGSSPDALNSAFFGVGYTDSSKVRSLASVTGRIGYSWDRFLGYVKGGAAWERDNYTIYSSVPGFRSATASETRGGWTVGIGGEYAFTNSLSGFVEYNWYGFGTEPNLFLTSGGLAFDYINIKENKSVLKVGINWMFGKGPVVANY